MADNAALSVRIQTLGKMGDIRERVAPYLLISAKKEKRVKF